MVPSVKVTSVLATFFIYFSWSNSPLPAQTNRKLSAEGNSVSARSICQAFAHCLVASASRARVAGSSSHRAAEKGRLGMGKEKSIKGKSVRGEAKGCALLRCPRRRGCRRQPLPPHLSYFSSSDSRASIAPSMPESFSFSASAVGALAPVYSFSLGSVPLGRAMA